MSKLKLALLASLFAMPSAKADSIEVQVTTWECGDACLAQLGITNLDNNPYYGFLQEWDRLYYTDVNYITGPCPAGIVHCPTFDYFVPGDFAAGSFPQQAEFAAYANAWVFNFIDLSLATADPPTSVPEPNMLVLMLQILLALAIVRYNGRSVQVQASVYSKHLGS